MFGLVKPYFKKMSKDEKRAYKCYYCGLCMGMGRETGFLSRALVNYDICLAYLVADSIRTDAEMKKARCPYSICKRVEYVDNPVLLDKMADVNYLLTYHKVLDDIQDNKSIKGKIAERLLRRKYCCIVEKNRETADRIVAGLEAIKATENENAFIRISDAAEPFGNVLASIVGDFIDDPIDAETVSAVFKYMGMWIYAVDACYDLKKDYKKGRYNPIIAGYGECDPDEVFAERKDELLEFLISCKQSMRQCVILLSCAKNESLIDNLFEYILPQEIADALR